jgi:ribonuclease HI
MNNNSEEKQSFLLRFDGGATPNPGRGSGAAVLFAADGTVIGECHDSYEYCTNNYAEYQGLIMGLEMALLHSVKRLRIEGDSMLVIQQVKGSWKVKVESLKSLYSEAKRLLDQFESVQIRHIPRELNSHADALTRLYR